MNKLLRLILVTVFISISIVPCTTGVVSGKYTKDGRPLIFKHRDSSWLDNKVMYINGEKYSFLAIVNSGDAKGDTVWMGTNSAGLSIMNSASYNLNVGVVDPAEDDEGVVMRGALGICATLQDFETYLDTLTKPISVSANFGVIDSYGGAAYYETDNTGYVKFDVNDPKVAPFGYMIRTNYSNTGSRNDGYGYIRYMTTTELFYEAEAMDKISDKFILIEVSRCLKNSLTEIDYAEDYPENGRAPHFVPGIDLTMRSSSASTFVCKGVKDGEDLSLNAMWVILGYQLAAPAIPLWVNAGSDLPEILLGDESGNAPLCSAALKLKDMIYPIKRGNGNDYIDLGKVLNDEGTGIYQTIRPIEDEIFRKSELVFDKLYTHGFDKTTVTQFYNWVDEFVKNSYRVKFGLEL
ncbi:MAG: hypothetical protein KKA84_14115 [Bacteroidetes bacterium]|nr:hypothetical protein [Bacteroidota bacterium]